MSMLREINIERISILGVGIAIGYFISSRSQYFNKNQNNNNNNGSNPNMTIDHIVIRTRDKTDECKEFYKLLGLNLEKEKEANKYLENISKNKVAFSNMRINESTVIDLFPNETSHIWCDKTKGNVDHFCISMSSKHHMNVLKLLKEANISCVKHFKASGAKGTGYSTYFNDPTGLYVELRNYDETSWKEIGEFANTMIECQ